MVDPIIMTMSMMYRNSYGQAVRTLRATLNGHSKKPYSMFCRSDGDVNVSFALRKVINSTHVIAKSMVTPCLCLVKGNLVGTFWISCSGPCNKLQNSVPYNYGGVLLLFLSEYGESDVMLSF